MDIGFKVNLLPSVNEVGPYKQKKDEKIKLTESSVLCVS